MAAGLESLGGFVLESILFKLDAKHAAVAACVSTRLRSAASDDALWRHFCARDFALYDQPLHPDGALCPSFKEAYKSWRGSFSMYPLSLVKRAKECWTSIRSWLSDNFPEISDTLRKGVSEAEIQQTEKILGVKLPAPTKVLYRLCDGQETFTKKAAKSKFLADLGIIGGYELYDHLVNVHLLPLRMVVSETKKLTREVSVLAMPEYVVVAASSYATKCFFLNCSSGQLYVGTKNLLENGEMMSCVPRELVRLTADANFDTPQDALLLWLEEHNRRLQSSIIKTRDLSSRSICLFPETSPYCSVAVTNGVQVRASTVFVPEASDANGGAESYFFSYSIRMSLLPEGCMLDGVYYSSCQLYSRHWIIRSKDTIVSNVHGEAVIGQYPLLLPGTDEFVYQSCTPVPNVPGSVEGSFTFVPGRLSRPEGRQFDVKVAPFILEKPEYIF